MHCRKFTGILLLLLVTAAAYAQQDALFTQYMFNKLEFNPAYAGSRDAFSADLISRFQWIGIEGAPRTISVTAHSSLRNPHIGLGLYAYRDEIGPTVDFNLMGCFAWRIVFPNSKLSFGLAGGIKYYNIEWDKLNSKQQGDLELINQTTNRVVPDADFGIYYYGKRFYAGLSSKHLLQNELTVSSTPQTEGSGYTKLLRNFYGIGGVTFNLSENVVFMPSTLIKYVQNAPLQADINASFFLFNRFMIGASYRTVNAIGVLVGIDVGKGFSVGYSFDWWWNSLNVYNQGSHEIRLGYELDLFNRNRLLTPRYF
jgi:type IX secretion system PorP/SprF family membrane protein